MRYDRSLSGASFRSVRTGRPADPADATLDAPLFFDLREVVQKLWHGKWLIATSAFCCWILAFLAVSQFEPMYRASAKVMFDLQSRNVVDVEQVLVRASGQDVSLQDEIEVLTSTNLIGRVVDRLQLADLPEFNPALRPPRETLMTRMMAQFDTGSPAFETLRDFGVLPAPMDVANPIPVEPEDIRRAVVTEVRQALSLRPIPGSKVIEVSFVSTRPDISARVVNTIAEHYILDQLDAKLDATRAATEWLSGRVDELRARVQSAEAAVEGARTNQAERSGQSPEITSQKLRATTQALTSVRAETSEARARLDRLGTALANDKDLGAVPEFRASNMIQTERAKRADLAAQALVLKTSVDPTHPVVIKLEAQLDRIDAAIRAEAERIVAAAHSELSAREKQLASLEAEVRTLEDTARRQSEDEIEIRQLEREAEASRVLYQNFLSRLKETSEQEELQSADARVLSPAEPPLRPQGDTARRTMVLGTMIGILLGIATIFLRDRMNDSYRLPQELEDLTGRPVLALVPTAGSRLGRSDVLARFRQDPKSSLSEAIRNLRTSILLANPKAPPQVVMFTSSTPREGKSTTAMLVAMTSRQMGKSAIIVDCDLRLPSLARILNSTDKGPGLLSHLREMAPLEDCIFRDPVTGLDALMTRPHEPATSVNAADILSTNRFRDLIETLKTRYDLVILDTPPVLAVTDARILSGLADAVVYAVRWNETPRAAALDGLKELTQVGAPVIGTVLTRVNEKRASAYRYGGRAYYGNGYRKGYAA